MESVNDGDCGIVKGENMDELKVEYYLEEEKPVLIGWEIPGELTVEELRILFDGVLEGLKNVE